MRRVAVCGAMTGSRWLMVPLAGAGTSAMLVTIGDESDGAGAVTTGLWAHPTRTLADNATNAEKKWRFICSLLRSWNVGSHDFLECVRVQPSPDMQSLGQRSTH